jgi:hypothetical protein
LCILLSISFVEPTYSENQNSNPVLVEKFGKSRAKEQKAAGQTAAHRIALQEVYLRKETALSGLTAQVELELDAVEDFSVLLVELSVCLDSGLDSDEDLEPFLPSGAALSLRA